MSDTPALEATVAGVLPEVVEVRRAVHRHPELAHQEFSTTQLVESTLRAGGLEPTMRTPQTGLVVDVGRGDRCVAFRCDLDALPIVEPPGAPFGSDVPGLMHACGHDAHTAIGVGVALALSRLPDFPGRVRVIFQPAEEVFPGGAHELVAEGVLDGVESIIAFHVDPGLEAGRIGLLSGPITSSADRFNITLEGPGGHTARPHQTVDLLFAAGKVLADLPALLDRMVDARRPLSLVFGTISGGAADNVIPARVEMSGTCRTLDRSLWDELPLLVERLSEEIAAPTGAKATVQYRRGIPPVVNDERIVDLLSGVVADVLGPAGPARTYTSMGAEDFARYLEHVPGALMRLGCKPEGGTADLHSTTFVLNEAALEVGVRVGVASLERLLGPDGFT